MAESVIVRVVSILEAFGPDSDVLSIGQIAHRTGLHVATASRLVQQLTDVGFLTRDHDRRVRLGIRLWELASRAAPTRGLRETALPFLEDLHAVVGHHAQLAVLSGAEVLFVERLSSPDAVINLSQVAGRLPVHVSASGLVLLAAGDASSVEQVLDQPMAAFTQQSITDPERLRREIADVRRQGYAFNPGHVHPRAAGIAAPVRDGEGRVVAAVAVVVPNTPVARQAIGAVQTAGRSISRALSSR